jgi:beta-N-acetylhexosaminidase
MDAVASVDSPAVRALLAGADMILRPGDASAVKESILNAVSEGLLTTNRIDESVLRILETKIDRGIGATPFGDPELIIGSAEHRAVAAGPAMDAD